MRLKLPKFILEFSGHLYLHKYPMFIVYRPDIHRVRGEDVRKILILLQPGDILLRRFDQYLNTIFDGSFWAHAGLYVGDNQVVHSVSEGCVEEDILNFCRCDAVAILRRKDGVTSQVSKALMLAKMHIPYDYDFNSANDDYYCTELVDVVNDHLFKDDYEMIGGNNILTPDGMFKSDKVDVILTINYKAKEVRHMKYGWKTIAGSILFGLGYAAKALGTTDPMFIAIGDGLIALGAVLAGVGARMAIANKK